MKKLTIIISVFLLIVCIFNTYCFSASGEKSFIYRNSFENDVTIKLPQGYGTDYKYFILCYSYNSRTGLCYYNLLFSNSILYYSNKTDVYSIDGSDFYCCFASRGRNETLIDLSSSSMSSFTKTSNGNYCSNQYFYTGLVYSNFDVERKDTQETHKSDINFFNYPSFVNSDDDLATGKFDYVIINGGDFNSFSSPDINFVIRKIISKTSNDVEYESQEIIYNTVLNHDSKYINNTAENSYYMYSIPQDDLGINFDNEGRYVFSLEYEYNGEYITDDHYITIGGLTDLDKQLNSDKVTQDKLDKQTDAIKENTETNKNIFERLGEMLNFINPFSEDFFVYKLIDLLINAIKSLFIPSDDFFSNYFTDLQNWFSDRLGFLFYPFELLLDLLDKILNINFTEPVLNIPDINEPFTNTKLISATRFNLNDLLNNSVFKTVHDIYLVGVDAVIVIGLVNLAKRKWEGVSNK